MNAKNKLIVSNFIEEIWNKHRFDQIDDFISGGFTDYSLPPNLPGNKEGMIRWIMQVGDSFKHKTTIESIVAEKDKVMLKIRMDLIHIGIWRNIKPTDKQISTVGYRYYKLVNGKINAHWCLLDGNSIENQLQASTHGRKIQQ